MVTTTFPNSLHDAYNLGPLIFWLLAIPVRVSPTTGTLWGSAILCGVALSSAVLDQFAAVDSYITAYIHGRSVTLVMPRPGGTVTSVAIARDLQWHGRRRSLPAPSKEYTGAPFDGASRWPTVTIAPHPRAVLTCVDIDRECQSQRSLSTKW
jgi:hypothetical protein